MGRIKLRQPWKVRTVKYDEIACIRGQPGQLHDDGLFDHGFLPVLCCGVGRLQLIGAYHPERATIGETIGCSTCGTIHTFREVAEPDPKYPGQAKLFVRPDGTTADLIQH